MAAHRLWEPHSPGSLSGGCRENSPLTGMVLIPLVKETFVQTLYKTYL